MTDYEDKPYWLAAPPYQERPPLDGSTKVDVAIVGSGVALMNMAGQIMRDLVLERESEFTDLFFVNRGLIPLPPEPLRFALGESITSMRFGKEKPKRAHNFAHRAVDHIGQMVDAHGIA